LWEVNTYEEVEDKPAGIVAPTIHARVAPLAGAKFLGTHDLPVRRVFPIKDLKATKAEDGTIKIRGYANTKGNKDRYGDIPTVFPALRNYVYELNQFSKNPVMLVDHKNSATWIAGSFDVLREDELGLYFEASFTKSDYPPVAHVRQVYAEGHGRALSISGRFFWEDKDNPNHLTYVDMIEISLVGVGADPNALGFADEKPAKDAAQLVAEAEAARVECEESCKGMLRMIENCMQPSGVQEVVDKINGLLAVQEE